MAWEKGSQEDETEEDDEADSAENFEGIILKTSQVYIKACVHELINCIYMNQKCIFKFVQRC